MDQTHRQKDSSEEASAVSLSPTLLSYCTDNRTGYPVSQPAIQPAQHFLPLLEVVVALLLSNAGRTVEFGLTICPVEILLYLVYLDAPTSQNQNKKGIYSPWKFALTRNLLWQEGAYNKHIGILNLNMWSNYTKDA